MGYAAPDRGRTGSPDAKGQQGESVLSALVVVWLVSTVAAGCLLSVLVGIQRVLRGAAIPSGRPHEEELPADKGEEGRGHQAADLAA
jgi:hypothetical protein